MVLGQLTSLDPRSEGLLIPNSVVDLAFEKVGERFCEIFKLKNFGKS